VSNPKELRAEAAMLTEKADEAERKIKAWREHANGCSRKAKEMEQGRGVRKRPSGNQFGYQFDGLAPPYADHRGGPAVALRQRRCDEGRRAQALRHDGAARDLRLPVETWPRTTRTCGCGASTGSWRSATASAGLGVLPDHAGDVVQAAAGRRPLPPQQHRALHLRHPRPTPWCPSTSRSRRGSSGPAERTAPSLTPSTTSSSQCQPRPLRRAVRPRPSLGLGLVGPWLRDRLRPFAGRR
jgi:hypothetical protein